MKFLSTLLFVFITTFCFAQNNYQDLDEAIEKGKSKKSEKLLTEIAVEESEIFIAFLEMGQFYYKHGELNKAVIYVEYAITHYELAPMNYQDTNFVNTKDSLYKLSIIILDELIKEEPTSVNYDTRGSLKAGIGLFNEAILDYSISISLDSLISNTYYNRALIYRKLSIIDSAILDYSKAIELDPRNFGSYKRINS